ncbi:transcription factor A, mitochondrial [Osmerus mordax]|uniref:transcription factor A, mitochondrial n=1 Tax=Osmerus mordax TaxID=8014 RepID=UPI00350F6668
MAPLMLLSASGGSLLAKSLGLCSSFSSLARWTSAFPATKCFSTTSGGPPKRPLNGYMRFLNQQRPIVLRQNPAIQFVDITKKVAQQWRTLSPEQKRPFEEASAVERERFKVILKQYQAQLSPAQSIALAEERREKLAQRKAVRKKRELNRLGKPKRPRSAFNIYMTEHFEEARGITFPMKMKTLSEDWKNKTDFQKQVYMQLSEDDMVRYKNEIKAWEEQMVEIGREDLVRRKWLVRTRAAVTGDTGVKKKRTVTKKKTVAKKAVAKKAVAKKAVAKKGSKVVKKVVTVKSAGGKKA